MPEPQPAIRTAVAADLPVVGFVTTAVDQEGGLELDDLFVDPGVASAGDRCTAAT